MALPALPEPEPVRRMIGAVGMVRRLRVIRALRCIGAVRTVGVRGMLRPLFLTCADGQPLAVRVAIFGVSPLARPLKAQIRRSS